MTYSTASARTLFYLVAVDALLAMFVLAFWLGS